MSTHQLKVTEGGSYQDMESRLEKTNSLAGQSKRGVVRSQNEGISEWHSLSEEDRAQDWSGHGNQTSRSTYFLQRSRLVRIKK